MGWGGGDRSIKTVDRRQWCLSTGGRKAGRAASSAGLGPRQWQKHMTLLSDPAASQGALGLEKVPGS